MSTSTSSLPLNFGYIFTKAGAFKLIALVLGLFALAFTDAAYQSPSYYNVECTQYNRGRQDHKPDYDLQGKELKITGPDEWSDALKRVRAPVSCEEEVPTTYDNCILQRDHLDFWRGLAKDRHAKEKDVDAFYRNRGQIKPDVCPSKFLVQVPYIMIILTWTFSLLGLVIFLFVDLNNKCPRFRRIDFIGHVLASVVFGLSTLALTGFDLWVFFSNYPCSKKAYDEIYEHQKKQFDKGNYQNAKKDYYGTIYAPVRRLCTLADADAVFKIWYLIIGTVFTAATTVFYFMATIQTAKMKNMPFVATVAIIGGQPVSMVASQRDSASSPNPQESVEASPSLKTGQ